MFLLLLTAIVGGYVWYIDFKSGYQSRQTQKHALITAQVWLASAQLRNKPEEFLAYRDSVLNSSAVSEQQMRDYLNRYQNEPEEYEDFARLVRQYIDSLSGGEEKGNISDTVKPAFPQSDSE